MKLEREIEEGELRDVIGDILQRASFQLASASYFCNRKCQFRDRIRLSFGS